MFFRQKHLFIYEGSEARQAEGGQLPLQEQRVRAHADQRPEERAHQTRGQWPGRWARGGRG